MHKQNKQYTIRWCYDIDEVIPTYNLIEYSDNYPKTSVILWQYSKDEPIVVDANGYILDFAVANAITDSFNRQNKQQGHKRCLNNDTIKTSK